MSGFRACVQTVLIERDRPGYAGAQITSEYVMLASRACACAERISSSNWRVISTQFKPNVQLHFTTAIWFTQFNLVLQCLPSLRWQHLCQIIDSISRSKAGDRRSPYLLLKVHIHVACSEAHKVIPTRYRGSPLAAPTTKLTEKRRIRTSPPYRFSRHICKVANPC